MSRAAISERFARFDLTGQVAWVVGGAGYLGSEVSRALADHGAHVVISNHDLTPAESLATELTAHGRSAEARLLDASQGDAVDQQAADIHDRHGRLDIAVFLQTNHSGQGYDDIDLEGLDVGIHVNLGGGLAVSRAAARHMTNGGSITLFSSMYGVVSPRPSNYPPGVDVNPVDYGMAKAAILQLSRYQAVKFAPQGIRVNAVVPGPFPKPAGQGAISELVDNLSQDVPLGRIGTAPEIAGAVVFLASPAASFVTGTQIVVDGGWTAW